MAADCNAGALPCQSSPQLWLSATGVLCGGHCVLLWVHQSHVPNHSNQIHLGGCRSKKSLAPNRPEHGAEQALQKTLQDTCLRVLMWENPSANHLIVSAMPARVSTKKKVEANPTTVTVYADKSRRRKWYTGKRNAFQNAHDVLIEMSFCLRKTWQLSNGVL